ncbi:MAG: hypothetical protein U1E53_07245 [Dongiaceae bacterium]
MTSLILLFLAAVLVLGLYCLLALPRDGWRRIAGPALLAVLYAAVLVGGARLLGRPLPSWLELPDQRDAELLSASFDEGKAIYVWLRVPWADEPRAYVLPWSEATAASLHDVMRQAEAEDGGGSAAMMRAPFGARTPDQEHPAYLQPVAALPPKRTD